MLQFLQRLNAWANRLLKRSNMLKCISHCSACLYVFNSILFYVTLHCWSWHIKLWWSFLYQLLERMLNVGATTVHRVKHTFLHQLSGWYLTLQKAHSYFPQFSKSLFMVALHLIIHEMSSSLGSLFGLGMVCHVSAHLLLTALRLNNCWYRPQSKHNSMPCYHVQMT